MRALVKQAWTELVVKHFKKTPSWSSTSLGCLLLVVMSHPWIQTLSLEEG